MAFAPQEWHDGEKYMHSLLKVPERVNPTFPGLSSYGSHLVLTSPLLTLGTLDKQGRPWTTIIGGEPSCMRPMGRSIIAVKSLVDLKYDPVVEILRDLQAQDEENGSIIGGLPIDLASRNRVKLSGRLISGRHGLEIHRLNDHDGVGEVRLMISVENSLGNCPKYLNKKKIIPALPKPVMISDSIPLPDIAVRLLAKADMFFISSSTSNDSRRSVGTNHRGGPPGFVRVLHNEASNGTALVFPEYSGNRLYQTLGNLHLYPRAGLCFPDFDTQDVLYVTGITEIIAGKEAASLLPRSNLVVKVTVTAARFVQGSLPFRGLQAELSPYNPSVRFLSTEHASNIAKTANATTVYARLVKKVLISPTIGKFQFSISDPKAAGSYSPGQYVALSFEEELGMGYSHMRDEDPRSLNDDFIRTFTISSAPQFLPSNQFEITIRNVGVVTNFLFRTQVRADLEVPLKGFGGSFTLPTRSKEVVPFVAGGIGITPLLAHAAAGLDLGLLRLLWMVNIRDINLVIDTFGRFPAMAPSARIYISGINETASDADTLLQRLGTFNICSVSTSRMSASDILPHRDLAETWYLCTGPTLRKPLLKWLEGKRLVYEDFNY